MDKDMAVELANGSRSERSERSEPLGAGSVAEVPSVVRRRHHTNTYKLRVLAEADECNQPGQLVALARREGLYASTITKWKEWRDRMQGQDTPPSDPRKPESYESLRNRLRKTERENKRLELKLKRAEGLIELQKKASELLESLNRTEGNNENS
jgi:hypothetical protein